MSIEIKMERIEGAEVDFTEWNFEDDVIEDLKPFVNKVLNNSLSVVFSEDGANVRLFVDLWDSLVEDLQIGCEIEIVEYETYACAKIPLRELIADAVECIDDDDCVSAKKMADALRALADLIDPTC